MATYTPDSLRNLFQSSFNLAQWYSFLQHFFNASELKEKPERIIENTSDEGYYLGNIDTTDSYRIGLFHYNIRQGSVANKRVGLRNLVKSFINPTWGEFDAALVVFDSGDHWRLSFICDIKGEATSPKRYTYVFGSDDLLYRTPIERFNFLKKKGISFENLRTAFSVEALSDEFFDKYREQYADFIQYVTGKRFVKVGSKWEEKVLGEPSATLMQAFDHNEKKIRDYVKKMMGRITFLHFLQRKGWMCGDLNYMQNMFENSPYKNDYLDSVLEPLFFGILNTKPAEREALFTDFGWDNSLLNEWKDIPYLNGGLFERDEEDEPESRFPADYFKRLFQFFSEYNFTIDENDPNDAEVGVDPEMLGKIFENLLEDNKDKGAFYTPKEIVRYMCQESLIAYLETNTSIAKDKIRNFVLSPEEGVADIPETKKQKLLTALEEVKICDPAIGSGAFPMGLLNELLHCREVLSGEHYDRAEIKKSIIQNNIYGVDIEKGAVDIARLRFWLSIVVDEETPSPLPNLDYKIMQGNSLIESFMGVDLSKLTYEKEYKKDKGEISLFDDEKNRLQKTVSHLLSSYYSCSDHDKKVKLQQEISDTINKQLETQAYNPEILRELRAINLAENNKFFLWHTWFSDVFNREDKEGFDIVIGNPPYISSKTQLSNPILAEQRNSLVASGKYSCLYQKWDLYIPFIEFGINQICSKNGVCAMIVPYPLTNQIYAQKLREMILTKFHLFELVDLNGTKIFNNATVSNCIPFIKRTKGENTTISNIDEKLHITPSFTKIYKDLIQDEKTYIWNVSNENRDSNRHSELLTLGDLCYISKGMVLYSEDGLFTNEDLISNTPDSIHCRPYLEAKDMDTYAINNIRYIEYDTHRVPDMVSRPTFRELYDRPKLMFNCLGKMKVMIDYSNQFVCQQGIRVALLWNDLHGVENRSILTSIKRYSRLSRCEMEKISTSFNMYYLLGILNSKYAAQLLTNIRGGDYHIVPEHIRNIPIASATVDVQNKVAEIVLKIIDLKRTHQNTSVLEAEIDKIVYSIYGLTDTEIKIIEQSI
jgi:type I restriction-modification system DNA methylase subunit